MEMSPYFCIEEDPYCGTSMGWGQGQKDVSPEGRHLNTRKCPGKWPSRPQRTGDLLWNFMQGYLTGESL